MPWRDENLLKTKLQSYQEAFLYATENNKLSPLSTEFIDKKKKIEKAAELCQKLIKEIEEEEQNPLDQTDENICDISVEYSNSQNQLLNLGVTDFNSKYISKDTVDQYESEMNHEQKDVYGIVNHLAHQENHRLKFCHCNHDISGLKQFISGVAG